MFVIYRILYTLARLPQHFFGQLCVVTVGSRYSCQNQWYRELTHNYSLYPTLSQRLHKLFSVMAAKNLNYCILGLEC